jgi:hypothetical protein
MDVVVVDCLSTQDVALSLSRDPPLLTHSLTCLHCITHTTQKNKKGSQREKAPGDCRQALGRKGCFLGQVGVRAHTERNGIAVSAQEAKGSRNIR